MGAIFRLEHANVMAYVTSRSAEAPRVLRSELIELLDSWSMEPRRFFLAEFHDWVEDMGGIAARALSLLGEASDAAGETLPPSRVNRVLSELRSALSAFSIFGLAVGDDERVREVARQLATAPLYGQLLMLIPVADARERNFEVLDPIPAFSTALHAAAEWPGIVFWTGAGASVFVPVDLVQQFSRELRDAVRRGLDGRAFPFSPFPFSHAGGRCIDECLRRWDRASPARASVRRLLHLSDLHFGTKYALQNVAILQAQLHDVVRAVNRVVITGDLFDSPKEEYATHFTNFRNIITQFSEGKEPISITGNHDQRLFGLFGNAYEQVARIGAPRVVVDDDCRMVFVCFNSSESGRWARGRIPARQFREIGGQYRALITARKELREYLSIVLVHHHPFSFEVAPETWVQRALAAVGIRDEKLLELANAQALHHWCMDWHIMTILHGHKHKFRYEEREVSRDDERMLLTGIGCGSSLGAEGSPVAYNILSWDPMGRRWVASIYESINGGDFRERVASVSPRLPGPAAA